MSHSPACSRGPLEQTKKIETKFNISKVWTSDTKASVDLVTVEYKGLSFSLI